MTFCTDDGQTAKFCHTIAKDNIGSSASHVGSNGDLPLLTCLCDNHSFLFMILGIEHIMNDAFLLKVMAQFF